MGCSKPVITGGGSSAEIRPLGVSTGRQRSRACNCGCATTSLGRLYRELPIPAASAVFWMSARSCCAHQVSMAAFGVGGETRIVGEVRAFDDLAGHPLPFAVVGGAQHHGLPVAGGERAVR